MIYRKNPETAKKVLVTLETRPKCICKETRMEGFNSSCRSADRLEYVQVLFLFKPSIPDCFFEREPFGTYRRSIF